MEFQSKYCTCCGAQNETNAKFCCNCGNTLDTQADQPQQNQQSYNSGYGNPYNTPGYGDPYNNSYNPPGYGKPYNAQYSTIFSYEGDIFGVPANEVAAFVGAKSAPKLMPDFYKKAATGSKAGFNIIVFLLGFFLGPFVMSFWFFHKKMNKIGAIIIAISIALSACSMGAVSILGDIMGKAAAYEFNNYSTYNPYAKSTNTYNYQNNDFDNFKTPFGNGNFDYYNYDYDYDFDYSVDTPSLQELGISYSQIGLILCLFGISAIGNLTLIIVCSIFANAWYLKFTLEKITKLKETNPDAKLMDISMAGGTSFTIWVILLFAYVIISIVLSTASFLNFLVDATDSVTKVWR